MSTLELDIPSLERKVSPEEWAVRVDLAAAQILGDEMTTLVTYDGRMATAAALLELQVAAPR